ncbi:amino acid/amide ABC transporter substrate-binding protein, HAAT family [Tistlia consotensis]|uniref:Amino acid/amide ABC transporter substrate-binding protein, HAAT family n=1 Tax=Tistlia consotensis USBA 355 TaxID=560819 RepID=A0A1Y6CUM5_9PROT|nr:transporter substrate-binding domain-containing protein [Tistlia consotensis]SMF79175.1 amino acid/amide ABC transporter substrate-binding protein, HAAT family [Tistlia consotensis USBA 355]SNS16029.1 amino acid/amide ABC transporter substrate-binding protein, HAAT family [Tistlia consotensis]
MAGKVPVGLVFSITGPYSAVSSAMLNGALLAIDQVNDDPAYDFDLEPHFIDPAASLEAYRSACEYFLKQLGISHVIGCYTSISRKEVIPCFEKYDGLLWYPSHYEGFETSGNVIYTGAAPNQHILPLAGHLARDYGTRAYCVGSNYVWAWENNRILRDIMAAKGGGVVSEKYVPVGSGDVEHLIRDIVRARPDFIFSTLIGDSRYAFVRAFQALGRREPAFAVERLPIADCSLSEPELLRIGPEASRGLISSSVYFQSIESDCNRRFIERYQARFGRQAVTSADAEASYIAVLLLAEALRAAGTTAIEAVRAAALGCGVEAPQGRVTIDAENAHCYLTPRLARARDDHQFEIFQAAPEPVKPDPYLVWVDLGEAGAPAEPERPEAAAWAAGAEAPGGARRPSLKLVKS